MFTISPSTLLPTGALVRHAKTGEYGIIVDASFSPAGNPTYVIQIPGTGWISERTWWFRTDTRLVTRTPNGGR